MDLHKFDSFIDKGKRIYPKLTNDWVIGTSLKEGKINISSKILKISFDLLECKFLKELSRKGIKFSRNNTIIGFFIFDKNREIINEYEYNEWLLKYNEIKRNSIRKSKLIVGNAYLLEDNSKIYFLGSKYISTFKGIINKRTSKIKLEKNMFTPISKRYIFSNTKGDTFEIYNKIIISKIDEKISLSKTKKLLYKFHSGNPFIAYFRDDCPIIKEYVFEPKRGSFYTII